MSINGANTLLNQYTPTFFIKNLEDGQILSYDAIKKAYVNKDIPDLVISGSTGEISVSVPLNVNGILGFPSMLPAECNITSVRVIIDVADPTVMVSVGVVGQFDKYMTVEDNDPSVQGIYISEIFVYEVSSVRPYVQVSSTSSTPNAFCRVIINF